MKDKVTTTLLIRLVTFIQIDSQAIAPVAATKVIDIIGREAGLKRSNA